MNTKKIIYFQYKAKYGDIMIRFNLYQYIYIYIYIYTHTHKHTHTHTTHTPHTHIVLILDENFRWHLEAFASELSYICHISYILFIHVKFRAVKLISKSIE